MILQLIIQTATPVGLSRFCLEDPKLILPSQQRVWPIGGAETQGPPVKLTSRLNHAAGKRFSAAWV